jgi:hypothetical protein
MDPTGAFWKGRRREILATLKTARDAEPVRENALALLELYGYMLRKEQEYADAKRLMPLLKNKRMVGAIWRAAIARVLTPRYVGGLEGVRVGVYGASSRRSKGG